jgi:alkaline phosphatase
VKSANGRIAVTADGGTRLYSIADKARGAGIAVGVVTSVGFSDATPGAWMAHNDSRSNGFAISDEGLWGDPNTTGTPAVSAAYSGGHGVSQPPLTVGLGGGHPVWCSGTFANSAIRNKLFGESGSPGAFTYVERVSGSGDGGPRLLSVAADSGTHRLAGLFGVNDGSVTTRRADGSGGDPENPTLAEMTLASLRVLGRATVGFTLMVEEGVIDHAAHANDMDGMIGAELSLYDTVATVVHWIEDPTTDATWENTLVIVMADHETGCLSAAPGAFPDAPLGEVSPRTLTLEKPLDTGRRASWEDADGNGAIDAGEAVYWAWNTSGHSNSLIPLYAKGAGASLFQQYANRNDPRRGAYIDNTDVFKVMNAVTHGWGEPSGLTD